MVFGGIVASPRGSLSPLQALRLANIYLEDATKEQDPDISIVLCHDAEVSLSQAKRVVKNSSSHTILQGIATAYVDLGNILQSRGRPVEAKASYKKAEKLGVLVKDHSPSVHPSRPTNTADKSSTTPSSEIHTQRHDILTLPSHIFVENVHPPSLEFKLPEPDEHLVNTPQLAGCLGLLQASQSPGEILDPTVYKWLQSIEKDTEEQDRLNMMAIDVIRAFKRDEIKDAKSVAEVVYLAPILDKDSFRDLLGSFYSGIDQSGLLDFHQLEGIAHMIQGADQGYLDADDLVKILQLLSARLRDTHRQSPNHIYQLTLTVSHVLDAMADTKVKDLDREKLHEPLSSYLSELKSSSDPYLVFQAAYAYQALLCVPDDETLWKGTMRRTGKVVRGVAGLVSAAKGLDLNKLIDGLGEIQEGLAGASEVVEMVKTAYVGASSLAKSGQDFMKCLKEGLSFERKRAWYSALRGADTLIRDGELATFRKLVCEIPYRRDPAFQWGVCQRLGEIASNPMWSGDARSSSIAFLGEIYRNDSVWGQQPSVKQWIINILMQLASSSVGGYQLHVIAAGALLQELEVDPDVKKQDLYRECREKGPSSHPLRVALPELGNPSLLDRVQNRPDVEGNLRLLKKQRIKDQGDSVYIHPQAKASLQASDDTSFPLTEKVREFLESDRKVFLLLGDSGAGKSTFIRELESELWLTYKKKTGRIPLYITLAAIDKPEHDMIAKHLRKSEFTEPQIRELKLHRKFTLICDGYDESQQTHNLYVSNRLNQPGEWDAQMVISCRSEYLGIDYQDRFQPGDRNQVSDSSLLQEAVLTPFSSDQIQAYIKQYVSVRQPLWQTDDYKQALELIPSLMDLMKNPFLLALSLEVLPRMVDPGQKSTATSITRVALYDQFMEQWFERGKKRLSEKNLSSKTRAVFETLSDEGFTHNGIDFLKKFAVAIYKEQDGQPVVEYSRFLDQGSWKDAFFTREDKKILREACPLMRNGNQHRFVHRSLLEYGLALAIFDPNDKRRRLPPNSTSDRRRGSVGSALSFELCDIQEQTLSNVEHGPDFESPLAWRYFGRDASLLQFLEERVQMEPAFKQQLFVYIEHSKTDKKWRKAASNAITILVRARVRFVGADLKGIQIPRADLSYGVFYRAQLQGADLRKVNLRGVWMQGADLSGAQMTGALFGELPYLKMSDAVRLCVYSPNGEVLAVALDDGDIDFYNVGDWAYIKTLKAHSGITWGIAYSPNEKQLASGGGDMLLKLWDLESNSCSHILSGHSMDVKCVVFSHQGERVVSGSFDRTIRIWDSLTGDCLMTVTELGGPVHCVVFSPDDSRIATSGEYHNIQIWSSQSGYCLRVMTGHSGDIDRIAYSPQGSQLASASDDMTVRLWDAETGTCLQVLAGHSGLANAVAYSPGGDQIASGSHDGTIRLCDVETGTCLQTLSGHSNAIFSVVYSPSGNQVASGDSEGTVRLWDVELGASRFISKSHSLEVECMACSPLGNQIATGSLDNTIRLWDTDTGACYRTLRGHKNSVYTVGFSPHGDRIVSGSSDKTLHVWESESGICLNELTGHSDWILGVAYSSDGGLIASASSDATVRLWDAGTGECCRVLAGHTRPVSDVSFSPNGSHIASCSFDYTIRLWDVGTGVCSRTLSGHFDYVNSIAHAPHGSLIASASSDATVRLWDTDTGSCSVIMIGHRHYVACVAFSSNGKLLASASVDRTVRIWDTCSGHSRAIIPEFQGVIHSIVWSTRLDSYSLFTCCEDGSVVRWDVEARDQEDESHVALQWISANGVLAMGGACIQDVRGLSHLNKKLLKQRGAVGEPVGRFREATKKVINIASVISKLKKSAE